MGTQEIATTRGAEAVRREADELVNVQRLGGLLAASGFFQDAHEMAQAAVKVLAGRELGIPPVAAMMGINIIKGKVALGGNLIASRIRAHGYEFRHKQFDATGCVLEFLGKPGPDGKRPILGESSFNAEDAARAQITSDMYKKYPRNMYFNRAMSNGAKWYCAEVFAGAPVYTPEELGADVDEEGNVVHAAETHDQIVSRRIQEEKAKIEQPKATYQATDSDLPEVLKGQAPQQQPITAEIVALWKRMKDRTSCLAEFAILKDRLAALGKEMEYYRVLGDYGVRHANELKRLEDYRKAAEKMMAIGVETEKTLLADEPEGVTE